MGTRPAYRDAAVALGRHLARHGISLVYGGGHIGLMGVLADAVLEGGGHVTGVIPTALAERELAHHGLSDLRVVDSMHTRKAMMAELSDGFVALPGGLGTLEELLEILTWNQLGLHAKPSALLNTDGYYAPLLALLERSIQEGFVAREALAGLTAVDDVTGLLEALAAAPESPLRRWISPEQS